MDEMDCGKISFRRNDFLLKWIDVMADNTEKAQESLKLTKTLTANRFSPCWPLFDC